MENHAALPESPKLVHAECRGACAGAGPSGAVQKENAAWPGRRFGSVYG